MLRSIPHNRMGSPARGLSLDMTWTAEIRPHAVIRAVGTSHEQPIRTRRPPPWPGQWPAKRAPETTEKTSRLPHFAHRNRSSISGTSPKPSATNRARSAAVVRGVGSTVSAPQSTPRVMLTLARPAGLHARLHILQRGHRTPARDRPDAHAGLGIVTDQREVPAQLNDGGQLAALVQGVADGIGGRFIDGEHQPISGI